jgi:hypothetical protein
MKKRRVGVSLGILGCVGLLGSSTRAQVPAEYLPEKLVASSTDEPGRVVMACTPLPAAPDAQPRIHCVFDQTQVEAPSPDAAEREAMKAGRALRGMYRLLGVGFWDVMATAFAEQATPSRKRALERIAQRDFPGLRREVEDERRATSLETCVVRAVHFELDLTRKQANLWEGNRPRPGCPASVTTVATLTRQPGRTWAEASYREVRGGGTWTLDDTCVDAAKTVTFAAPARAAYPAVCKRIALE